MAASFSSGGGSSFIRSGRSPVSSSSAAPMPDPIAGADTGTGARRNLFVRGGGGDNDHDEHNPNQPDHIPLKDEHTMGVHLQAHTIPPTIDEATVAAVNAAALSAAAAATATTAATATATSSETHAYGHSPLPTQQNHVQSPSHSRPQHYISVPHRLTLPLYESQSLVSSPTDTMASPIAHGRSHSTPNSARLVEELYQYDVAEREHAQATERAHNQSRFHRLEHENRMLRGEMAKSQQDSVRLAAETASLKRELNRSRTDIATLRASIRARTAPRSKPRSRRSTATRQRAHVHDDFCAPSVSAGMEKYAQLSGLQATRTPTRTPTRTSSSSSSAAAAAGTGADDDESVYSTASDTLSLLEFEKMGRQTKFKRRGDIDPIQRMFEMQRDLVEKTLVAQQLQSHINVMQQHRTTLVHDLNRARTVASKWKEKYQHAKLPKTTEADLRVKQLEGQLSASQQRVAKLRNELTEHKTRTAVQLETSLVTSDENKSLKSLSQSQAKQISQLSNEMVLLNLKLSQQTPSASGTASPLHRAHSRNRKNAPHTHSQPHTRARARRAKISKPASARKAAVDYSNVFHSESNPWVAVSHFAQEQTQLLQQIIECKELASCKLETAIEPTHSQSPEDDHSASGFESESASASATESAFPKTSTVDQVTGAASLAKQLLSRAQEQLQSSLARHADLAEFAAEHHTNSTVDRGQLFRETRMKNIKRRVLQAWSTALHRRQQQAVALNRIMTSVLVRYTRNVWSRWVGFTQSTQLASVLNLLPTHDTTTDEHGIVQVDTASALSQTPSTVVTVNHSLSVLHDLERRIKGTISAREWELKQQQILAKQQLLRERMKAVFKNNSSTVRNCFLGWRTVVDEVRQQRLARLNAILQRHRLRMQQKALSVWTRFSMLHREAQARVGMTEQLQSAKSTLSQRIAQAFASNLRSRDQQLMVSAFIRFKRNWHNRRLQRRVMGRLVTHIEKSELAQGFNTWRHYTSKSAAADSQKLQEELQRLREQEHANFVQGRFDHLQYFLNSRKRFFRLKLFMKWREAFAARRAKANTLVQSHLVISRSYHSSLIRKAFAQWREQFVACDRARTRQQELMGRYLKRFVQARLWQAFRQWRQTAIAERHAEIELRVRQQMESQASALEGQLLAVKQRAALNMARSIRGGSVAPLFVGWRLYTKQQKRLRDLRDEVEKDVLRENGAEARHLAAALKEERQRAAHTQASLEEAQSQMSRMRSRLIGMTMQRWTHGSIASCFGAWRDYVRSRKQRAAARERADEVRDDMLQEIEALREQLKQSKMRSAQTVISRWQHSTMLPAFKAWRMYTRRRKRERAQLELQQEEDSAAQEHHDSAISSLHDQLRKYKQQVARSTILAWTSKTVTTTFAAWRRFVAQAKQQRLQDAIQSSQERAARSILLRWQNSTTANAFYSWKRYADSQKRKRQFELALESNQGELQERFAAEKLKLLGVVSKAHHKVSIAAAFKAWKAYTIMTHQRRKAKAAVQSLQEQFAEEKHRMERQLRLQQKKASIAVLRHASRNTVTVTFLQWKLWASQQRRERDTLQRKEVHDQAQSQMQFNLKRAKSRAKLAIITKWRTSTVSRAFAAWQSFTMEEQNRRKRLNSIMKRTVQRLTNQTLWAGFRTWRNAAQSAWRSDMEERLQEQATRARQIALVRWRNRHVIPAFERWNQFVKERQRRRLMIHQTLTRLARSNLWGAWRQWQRFVDRDRLAEAHSLWNQQSHDQRVKAASALLSVSTQGRVRRLFMQWKAFAYEQKTNRRLTNVREKASLAMLQRSRATSVRQSFLTWRLHARQNAETRRMEEYHSRTVTQVVLRQWRRHLLTTRFLAWRKVSSASSIGRNHAEQVALVRDRATRSMLNRSELNIKIMAFRDWRDFVRKTKVERELAELRQQHLDHLAESRQKTSVMLLRRWQCRSTAAAFRSWQEYVVQRREQKMQVLEQTVARLQHTYTWRAWRTWKNFVEQDRVAELRQEMDREREQFRQEMAAHRERTSAALIQKWRNMSMISAFQRWKSNASSQRENRQRVLSRTLTRMANNQLWQGFRVWRNFIEADRVADLKAKLEQDNQNLRDAMREHKQNAGKRIIKQWRTATIARAFRAWSSYTNQQAANKETVIVSTIRRMHNSLLYSGWRTWRRNVEQQRVAEVQQQMEEKLREMHDGARQQRLQYRLKQIANWSRKSMVGAFEVWRDFVAARRERKRDLMDRTLRRMTNSLVWGAWRKWTRVVEQDKVSDFQASLQAENAALKSTMAEHRAKTANAIIKRLQHASLIPAFNTWLKYATERKQQRVYLVERTVKRLANSKLYCAFRQWRLFVEDDKIDNLRSTMEAANAELRNQLAAQQHASASSLMRRWAKRGMAKSFLAWARYSRERAIRRRTVLTKTVKRLQNGKTWQAFRTWRNFVAQSNVALLQQRIEEQSRHMEDTVRAHKERTRAGIIRRWRTSTLTPAFKAWRAHVNERKQHADDLMNRTICRMRNGRMYAGWRKWRQFVEQDRVDEVRSSMGKQMQALQEQLDQHHASKIELVMRRWRHKTLVPAFDAWRQHIDRKKKRRKELMDRTLKRFVNGAKWGAWRKWKQAVEDEKVNEIRAAMQAESDQLRDALARTHGQRINALMQRWRNRSACSAFVAWATWARQRAERRKELMDRTLKRMLQTKLWSAWRQWASHVEQMRVEEVRSKMDAELHNVKMQTAVARWQQQQRNLMTRSFLAWTSHIRQNKARKLLYHLGAKYVEGSERRIRTSVFHKWRTQFLESSARRRFQQHGTAMLGARSMNRTVAGHFLAWKSTIVRQRALKKNTLQMLASGRRSALSQALNRWRSNCHAIRLAEVQQSAAASVCEKDNRIATMSQLVQQLQHKRNNMADSYALGRSEMRLTLTSFYKWRVQASSSKFRRLEQQRAHLVKQHEQVVADRAANEQDMQTQLAEMRRALAEKEETLSAKEKQWKQHLEENVAQTEQDWNQKANAVHEKMQILNEEIIRLRVQLDQDHGQLQLVTDENQSLHASLLSVQELEATRRDEMLKTLEDQMLLSRARQMAQRVLTHWRSTAVKQCHRNKTLRRVFGVIAPRLIQTRLHQVWRHWRVYTLHDDREELQHTVTHVRARNMKLLRRLAAHAPTVTAATDDTLSLDESAIDMVRSGDSFAGSPGRRHAWMDPDLIPTRDNTYVSVAKPRVARPHSAGSPHLSTSSSSAVASAFVRSSRLAGLEAAARSSHRSADEPINELHADYLAAENAKLRRQLQNRGVRPVQQQKPSRRNKNLPKRVRNDESFLQSTHSSRDKQAGVSVTIAEDWGSALNAVTGTQDYGNVSPRTLAKERPRSPDRASWESVRQYFNFES
jgi:hypothetical protein